MKKTLFLVMLLATSAIFGCSGGGEEGAANVNKDVQSGTPPAGLDGAAPDGTPSPSSGGGPSTPSSTP